MKKIVFCLQTMVLGGVEKELITVLKQIHGDYEITLLLLYLEDAEIVREIPSDVKIRVIGIDKGYYCAGAIDLFKQRLKKGNLFEAASIAVKRCLKLGMPHSNTNITEIPAPDDIFDIAVCYHVHSPLMLKYVAEKIRAHKKVAWIHNDFYASGYPIQRVKKYVVKYDEFVAVSQKVEHEFRGCCPWYQGGICTAYNYLDENEITARSQETVDDPWFSNEKTVRILTVGRFSQQKGIDLAISVCAMLKKEKLDFHWFLIGYGEQESLYRKLIAEYNLGDCFTILGRKTNPYPYIRNCDIYVQPSRHEAFGLVIAEAKILRKPIVCTDFDGADEQLINGRNGIIVPVNDTEALFEAISKLIQMPEARVSLSQELEKWSPEDDLQEIVKHFE